MAIKFTGIEFLPNNGEKNNLVSATGVLEPNKTTELLINAVKKTISKPKKMLDLGCNTGVIVLSLWLKGLAKEPICASDLCESSMSCSQENFRRY